MIVHDHSHGYRHNHRDSWRAGRARRARLGRSLLAGLVTLAGGVGLAACSSSSKVSAPPRSTTTLPPRTTHPRHPAPTFVPGQAILASSPSRYGTIVALVAGLGGVAVYAQAGETPQHIACLGACTQTWQPVGSVGTPRVLQAPGGPKTSLITTFTRPDGRSQVAYAGHPLYTYVGDRRAGQINGEGSLGFWFVVSPSGQLVR